MFPLSVTQENAIKPTACKEFGNERPMTDQWLLDITALLGGVYVKSNVDYILAGLVRSMYFCMKTCFLLNRVSVCSLNALLLATSRVSKETGQSDQNKSHSVCIASSMNNIGLCSAWSALKCGAFQSHFFVPEGGLPMKDLMHVGHCVWIKVYTLILNQ